MSRTPARRAATPSPVSKDQPLIDDIRLLGRMLGDVIREQEGEPAYALIEQIRQLSVAFRRHDDASADKALKKLLKGLSSDQTVSVIRAFTYFSHLANLAEDRHHIRRRAIHERAGQQQQGSLGLALERLRQAGVAPHAVADALARAHVSPVLTAHPTEVQRKSILDAERAIARLLVERDTASPRELADIDRQIRARITQLWQTRLLRFTKLTVADEIENSLSYYESTFLEQIPRLYRELEDDLGQPVAPFLRMGQWIGGDRDGNPNVTADTLELALRSQGEMVLRHHLTQVHLLGGELSVSAMLSGVTPGHAGPGRTLARHQRTPPGRALPARADRRVCTSGGHLAGTHRHRSGPSCGGAAAPIHIGRRIPGRPAHHRDLAPGPPWRSTGRGPAAAPDPLGGGVRFPPGHAGPSTEFRPARTCGGGTAGPCPHRVRLRRARRTEPAVPAAAGAERCPPAARAGRRLQRAHAG